MDALDLFGSEEATYRCSLWLYNSTQGVLSLGEPHDSVGDAEEALRDYSGLDLEFKRERIMNGISKHAAQVYKAKRNEAVVIRAETGDVESHAPIPDQWFPPGDPRRKS